MSQEAVQAIGEYVEYLETEQAPKSRASFRLGRDKFEQKLRLEDGTGLNSHWRNLLTVYEMALRLLGIESEGSVGEGLFIGYRGYDASALGVAFPFGYGLSYTTGPLPVQVASAWAKVFRLSLPNRKPRAARPAAVEPAAVGPVAEPAVAAAH